jgi:DNA-binding transcriptional regulator GbsR (MarR family)
MQSTELAGLTEVRDFMLSICYISEGRGWATLDEIAEMTGVHETHVSAILRYLRKARYGSYIVDKRHRENVGTYEYRVKKGLFRLLSDPRVHETFGKQHCPPSRRMTAPHGFCDRDSKIKVSRHVPSV